MNETVISWTAVNWITILLMVFVGFMVLNLIGAMIMKTKGNNGA